MNNLILCEGFDDVFILGYYLFKTEKWTYDPSGKFSDLYGFPKVNFRNQVIEVYKKGKDSLAIWCVGGKDSFEKPLDFVRKVNNNYPDRGIHQVFILSDRDDYQIADCLSKMQNMLNEHGISIGTLQNNQKNTVRYEEEGEVYELNVIPTIIPFEEDGALETVLMNAIEEIGKEEQFIVGEAKKYVDEICKSGNVKSYLQHNREILKAKFSSCISITNPDRSTALFNTLLMSHSWEESETIKKHFGVYNELL